MKYFQWSNSLQNFIFLLSNREMVAEGLLNPREGIFTAKERDILAILARCDEAEMDVVKAYLAAAKMLAEKEVNVTLAALANSEQKR